MRSVSYCIYSIFTDNFVLYYFDFSCPSVHETPPLNRLVLTTKTNRQNGSFVFSCILADRILTFQGLLEARVELRQLLLNSHERLKDLIFLDIALDSTVRTAIERAYEELNDAEPEVFHDIYL